MAWVEKRGDRYRIKFRYGGRNLQCGLDTGDETEATNLLGRFKENLALLKRGRLEVPPGCELGRFLLSDGKVAAKPVLEESVGLGELFKRYHARETGGKEANTRYTEKIHTDHLLKVMGARTPVRSITTDALQRYVDRRAKESWRGKRVQHRTIQKEIGTFAAIWNTFALPLNLVSGPAPTKGLRYEKGKSKERFQTWEQIERRVARGGSADLWDCLFLSTAQVVEVLEYVKDTGKAPWVHPMFCFAAYTGARRSEILRSEIADFDFDAGVVRIREKKKDKSKDLTFRDVPLSPKLAEVMKAWLAVHPGGELVVCDRPNEPVTPAMSSHHFGWALEGSKWAVVKGWHCFRHSFCSNCAAAGIDQRMISAWMGHMTAEMEARYRHLFPKQEQEALSRVFG